MDTKQFEELVGQALDSLPPEIEAGLDNVVIIIQDFPSPEQMEENDIRDRYGLLGLYEGIALPDRGEGYNMVAPDKITIFQKPLEALRLNPAETIEEICKTVLHELAHHLGFSEDHLHDLGYD